MFSKNELRSELRKRRQDFAENHIDRGFSLIAPPALTQLVRSANIIAGYVKYGSEMDPANILDRIFEMGLAVALPCLTGRSANLIFRKWQPGDAMEQADYGFMQPLPSAEACEPDVILTPLVGFDRCLNRLGQGAGHYDRTFAALPGSLRIGLAWSIQECDALTPDPWDMPLDAVLTEKEWIIGPSSRITA